MLYFVNDYSEGAHEKILQALIDTNREKHAGYGGDVYTESAKEKIKEACRCPEADVHFLVGGTQTNATVISAMLRSYEGVIAATTGHVSLHEAGAIEYTGHKVLEIEHEEGKISAQAVGNYLETFYADGNHAHMVYPGMVYISHPTEYGTLYTREELKELSEICRDYEIPLYLDGARMGYGLVSPGNDVMLPELAALVDVFYLGGTKVGALCGEAVVFTKQNTPDHFTTIIKQRGALLAKGRLLGIQFDTLFTDGLYMEIAKNAMHTAERLKAAFREKGYTFLIDSPTNQIFIVLENGELKRLEEEVAFSFWEKYDDEHTVVRFATSWATTDEEIDALIKLL